MKKDKGFNFQPRLLKKDFGYIMDNKTFLNKSSAMKYIDCSLLTLDRKRSKGEINGIDYNGQVYYDTVELDLYLNKSFKINA